MDPGDHKVDLLVKVSMGWDLGEVALSDLPNESTCMRDHFLVVFKTF